MACCSPGPQAPLQPTARSRAGQEKGTVAPGSSPSRPLTSRRRLLHRESRSPFSRDGWEEQTISPLARSKVPGSLHTRGCISSLLPGQAQGWHLPGAPADCGAALSSQAGHPVRGLLTRRVRGLHGRVLHSCRSSEQPIRLKRGAGGRDWLERARLH